MRFEKNRKQYILKNKDTSVLSFDYEKIIDKTTIGEFTSYKIKHIKILEPDLLPIGYPNTVDSSELKKWIERRKIPKNRVNRERVLNFKINSLKYELTNFMNYIDISYGLSLNDSYWIVPANENLLWKDCNLYKNKFSDVISLVAFGEKLPPNWDKENINLSPEYTTNGMLVKCWTILNDEIHLLKKSSEYYKKEAFSEYYMSQIASIMNFEHINYDIVKYHNSIASACKLFTSEDIGFVPIYHTLKKRDLAKSGVEVLEKIYKIYEKDKLEDLMVFDSLIYNTDRHLGNFGILIDNNTGKILKSAPIFDNGNSILSFFEETTDLEKIENYYISRFDLTFDILAKFFVRERHRKGLENLVNFKFKRHKEHNLSENLLELGEKFISKRAKTILNILDKNLEKTT